MDASQPGPDDVVPVDPVTPTLNARIVALLEVVICSDYPTQLAIAATFAALGFRPQQGGSLSLTYVAGISLLDTLLLIGLIVFFLKARGESPRDVIFGDRPIGAEMIAGVPLMFVAFGIALVILLGIQAIAPWLHTVPRNPLEDLVKTPGDAVVFGVVLIIAGGVREEVQRAFLLRRFERWLGGPVVGIVLTSIVFGSGHFLQGADAAIATGVLGAFWGVVYLRRRSVGAPVVSHAGFNLVQVLQYLAFAR